MTKIIFLCHGNICRSPMAEFVMKDLVEKAGLSGQFEIASAATSTEEIGNPVYPPARRKLAEHGISCAGKTARQMTRRDYEVYDYLIAMDLKGEQLTSTEMASRLQGIMNSGGSRIDFVIGGSLGLSPEVLQRADLRLCFGKPTFSHQIFRIMLLEQIYRCFKIINNEPYHK